MSTDQTPPTFLGLAVKIERGTSANGKVPQSSRKSGHAPMCKTAHVGLFATYRTTDKGKSVMRYREVENIGETDGPAAEFAAMTLAAMYIQGRTPADPEAHCKADGSKAAPVPLWTNLSHVTPIHHEQAATPALRLS